MIKAVLLFIVGLLLLIKGGDWFVDGATGIAKRFHVPDLLIGATVVSIGTTLPEVMVSATSAVQGLGDMAYGNAIGSIICNTSLIAALTIAIKPSDVPRKSMIKPVIFFFVAAIIYTGVAFVTGNFTRFTGIFLLCIFVCYMVVLILQAKKEMKAAQTAQIDNDNKDKEKEHALWLDLVLLVVGAALITLGANLLVDNGTYIATELGVPQTVIALTFVALGTSLPELVTAITSLAKGHGALSLGNIIGANLFNLVLVSGVSITLAPFKLPTEKLAPFSLFGTNNASLVIDVPVMLGVMILMTIPTLITGKLRRWQGIALLAIYCGYCVFQFAL